MALVRRPSKSTLDGSDSDRERPESYYGDGYQESERERRERRRKEREMREGKGKRSDGDADRSQWDRGRTAARNAYDDGIGGVGGVLLVMVLAVVALFCVTRKPRNSSPTDRDRSRRPVSDVGDRRLRRRGSSTE